MCFITFRWLLWVSCVSIGVSRAGDSGLRVLLQNQANQELISHLGTRFEIVHPVQIGQDWGRGLSTRIVGANNSVSHLERTSFLIETFEHKLHLDLHLNKNLFPSTLVQLVYKKDTLPLAINKLPENCHYQATIRDHPTASAAFHTCNGIRGIILLENKIFLLHPLRGNASDDMPHLLYHLSMDEGPNCANTDEMEHPLEKNLRILAEENASTKEKYLELALVIDRTLLEKFKSSPSEVIKSTIEMINYAHMLYRPLNTSLSVVFVEVWAEDQMKMDSDIRENLKHFQSYSSRRIQRLSIDAAHLLSGMDFESKKNGIAVSNSICTPNAVGVTMVTDVFRPHQTANILSHLIGHNLGMSHDSKDCDCSTDSGCIMVNDTPFTGSREFSDCSLKDYKKTLEQGYGNCLFNKPTMRVSTCGNSIVEASEECDCGSPEECSKYNPCCDPMSCKFIKHAECSSGPCCKKCKLLSSDHLCRSSKGECDIPEFCDGKHGECPEDIYKRNGAICAGGLGYCFQGLCPLLKTQCQHIWGETADQANVACYERLNVLGTPNGNCGSDHRGELNKCTIEDSYCGSLQCSEGGKSPIANDILPIDFVVYKMNAQGTIHECKARTFSAGDLKYGLVEDGTKCGYQKMCLHQTCASIHGMSTGKCPLEEAHATCSGHGVCTNVNTCFCEEGWKGEACEIVDEENHWGSSSEYYDSGAPLENPQYGENELYFDPNLATIVLAASVFIGIVLVLLVVLFIFHRNLWTKKSSSR